MSNSDKAYHLIFDLIDAHRAQDRLALGEAFKALAALGAAGTASGLMVRLRMCPPETSELFLEIVSMFAKRVSSKEEQMEVIHALQIL